MKRLLDSAWREVRYAVRALRRDPAPTAVVVLTLALGLGVNTAVFSVVDAVLLRPLPVTSQDRIVVFWQQELKRGHDLLDGSLPDFRDWRARNHAFEDMAAFASINWSNPIRGPRETDRVSYRAVSASFFETLGAHAALGRTFDSDADDPGAARVVVLSHALWKTRFGGDAGVVGSSIILADKPRTVIPAGAELWLPVGPELAEIARGNGWSDEQMRGIGMLLAVGRLQKGVDLPNATRAMDAIIPVESEHGHPDSTLTVRLTPLSYYVFGQARPAVLALWAGVALILCMACANVASVLLARSVSREKATLLRLGPSVRSHPRRSHHVRDRHRPAPRGEPPGLLHPRAAGGQRRSHRRTPLRVGGSTRSQFTRAAFPRHRVDSAAAHADARDSAAPPRRARKAPGPPGGALPPVRERDSRAAAAAPPGSEPAAAVRAGSGYPRGAVQHPLTARARRRGRTARAPLAPAPALHEWSARRCGSLSPREPSRSSAPTGPTRMSPDNSSLQPPLAQARLQVTFDRP